MSKLAKDEPINRRQFLKVVGFATGGVALAPLLSAARPVEDFRKTRRGRIYRGSPDGKVLSSADGKTWSVMTDFGPQFHVREVRAVSEEWVLATLEMGELQLMLKSRDDRTWYTLDYADPEQGA